MDDPSQAARAAAAAVGRPEATGSASFQRVARLAAELLQAPAALVSRAEEGWLFIESGAGLPTNWNSPLRLPLRESFCQHLAGNTPLVVADARRDPRFAALAAVRELGWFPT